MVGKDNDDDDEEKKDSTCVFTLTDCIRKEKNIIKKERERERERYETKPRKAIFHFSYD